MRMVRNLRAFAKGVLAALNNLPDGVRINGIIVLPDSLPFEEEEINLTAFVEDE